VILLHGPDGEPVEWRPVSLCTQCGPMPHIVGEFGSLTCAACNSRPLTPLWKRVDGDAS
jgi:hypothetical protein